MFDAKPSRLDRSVLFLSLLLGLAAPMQGCGDDEETTASDDEETSGGEDTFAESDGEELERPPGSSRPDDDGSEPGSSSSGGDSSGGNGTSGNGASGSSSDEGASETGSSDEGTTGGSAAEEEAEPDAAEVFGTTRAEQCRVPERRTPNNSAMTAFRSGVRSAAAGRVEDAQRSFQQALREDRNAYNAAYNLGVLADRQGQENRALEYYRQAIRAQADYERAAEGMVTIYFRRGSVPDALAFIQPIARRFTTNLDIQALYAEVLVRAERYDEAWDVARAALRCNERHVPTLTALVKASLRQGRKELAESILEQAIAIDERNAELHYIQGTLFREEEGRFRDALREFRRAVELRPDFAEARMELGVAQLAGGNYTEALQNFEAAARLAPQVLAVQLSLADGYRATQQWQKAKAGYDKVLEMDPNQARVHYNLALMYQTAGENFPGLDDLSSLQRAKEEFIRYRDAMGPRVPDDIDLDAILSDLDRQISRIERRREREARRAAQAAAQEGQGEGG